MKRTVTHVDLNTAAAFWRLFGFYYYYFVCVREIFFQLTLRHLKCEENTINLTFFFFIIIAYNQKKAN